MARDIYAEVTNALVASIEADPAKPIMPWNRSGTSEMPSNIASGDGYNGINVINLWVTSQVSGFATSIWGIRPFCEFVLGELGTPDLPALNQSHQG